MSRHAVGRGFVAGLVAGFVGSLVMNGFQTIWGLFAPPRQVRSAKGEFEEDTTIRTAEAISKGLFDHSLSERERRVAGPVVHYVFGSLVGGLYGAVAERRPSVTAGAGLPFGVVFWLSADETAVPLLRLSAPPGRYPMSVHLYALVSHLVFGWTAEAVRKTLRGRP